MTQSETTIFYPLDVDPIFFHILASNNSWVVISLINERVNLNYGRFVTSYNLT